MAEEVKIVDVAGGPAAEATLQELLKTMKQMAAKTGKGEGAAGEAQKQYNQSVKNGTTAKKDNNKKVKESTEEFGKLASAVNLAGKGFGLFYNAVGSTIGIMTNFAGAVTKATSIGDLLEAFPVFGSVLGKATGYFEDSLSTFRQLSDVGAGFGNDMMAMRKASAESALSLDQFAQMVTNNSGMLGLLGGTVSEGAARLGRLTKGLRQADSGLMQLGFTQEELNEGMAGFIELQARSGRLRRMSDGQLTEGARGYLLELDKLSRVTGQSRKELQDEMNQRMQSANVNVMASQLNEEGATKFLANLEQTSSLLGKGMSDVMADLGDGVAQSDFARTLAATVPGIQDLAEANARGELSQEEYQRKMQQLAPQIAEFADNMGAAGVQQLQGKAGFAEFMESLANARTYTQRLANAQDAAAEQQRKSKLTDTFAIFSQTIQNIRSEIEDALIESEVLETVGTALTGVSNILVEVTKGITENVIKFLKSDDFQVTVERFKTYIEDMAEKGQNFVSYLRTEEFKEKIDSFIQSIKNAWISVSNFVSEIGEVGIKQAIANALGAEEGETLGDVVKNNIVDGLQSLWDNAGLATKIGAGLVALFTGAKIVGALKNSIGGLFGGLGGGAAKAGGAAGGAGAAVGGLGDGIGKGLGGILKGLAAGIGAFGNPKIVAGAAGLAAAIALIGGAIAGATWMVGKSLPTMAEGLKSFEDLDGAKLIDAGKGMGAVAAGMAAFGAGSAVSGLGSLVGGITQGLVSLFGGDDPLEKMKEFQKHNFDAERIESNANAVVAFSRAMAAQGAGGAASGAGAAVSAIGDTIAGFFGGDSGIPYDDMIAFQQYTFDTEKIKANAAAMVAFNGALTSSSSAQATGGVGNAVGAIGNAISSFFGGDTPFDQVKDFGAMNINAEGVAANAEAMVNMANALGSFSGSEVSEIEIPNRTINALQRLSSLDNIAGIDTLATNLQAVADVTGLTSQVAELNSLDASSVVSYNSAIENLVATLENLNDVLAEDNKGTFGGGTGVAAADIVSQGNLGGNSSDQQLAKLDQLNTTMMSLLTELRENTEFNRRTSKAVRAGGNLQA